MNKISMSNQAVIQETSLFSRQKHPFHILGPSAFPFLTGTFLLAGLIPQIFYMHGVSFAFLPRGVLMYVGFLGFFAVVMAGFASIVAESAEGFHTKKVQAGLRMGMLLFIVSEVMFFFAFFGSFFHFSLIPAIAVGAVGPPTGTQELDVGGLPLVNTLLLLTSGVTITMAHAYIVKKNLKAFSGYLFLTILLGITFLFCQAYEYKYGVKFSGRDNIYGSIFFITTGFHGLHVTIGTLFLTYCGARQNFVEFIEFGYRLAMIPRGSCNPTFTASHHFGFEAAAGYGHFVDVVGLFLFITIYGGGSA